MKRSRSYKIFTLTFVLIISFCASFLSAQYFGRNKVQYESFDFQILKTEHFDVYFYEEEREAAIIAARMAERWYARLSSMLNHQLKTRQPLILYSSSPHFQQTTTIPNYIGEGTGGVTEMFKRRVILPFGPSLAETDHVIGHELVHAFQYDITAYGGNQMSGMATSLSRLPLWLIEGMSEYLSIGSVDPHTSMWMRDASLHEKLPSIKKLINPRYFPYRYGQSLWAYITGKWGDETVSTILRTAGQTGSYEEAFKSVLGISIEDLSKEWHSSLTDLSNSVADITISADKTARLLFKGDEKNRLNVSPSLSPDGNKIVFLSTKSMVSIDMYQADATTGEIERKLIRSTVDPHFESLQFIKSSGSWNSDGSQFAFGAITKGQPVLVIINTETGRREGEVLFPDLGEILSPSWSPEGRHVVFSALRGGFTDLFHYDLVTEELKKMTDDPFADLYPAWSPDGRYIAFSTERFSTNLSILDTGSYDLAVMDIETGQIKKIQTFRGKKNINPQWSPDSKNLYFISDQNGISNIYRVDLEIQKISQLTNLYTGTTGITSLSPAISVSRETNQLVFCVYEKGNFNIYAIDSLNELDAVDTITEYQDVFPSVLPPRTKSSGRLSGLLKNPFYGLPEQLEYEVEEYEPKLQLDYISPPQLGVGVDRFGAYGGGGLVMYFSDMLGYYSLAGMAQVSSRLADSAFLVGYQNSRHRMNWGAVAQRIPYVYSAFGLGFGEVGGIPAYIEEEFVFRQVNYEFSGIAAYPFSQVSRVELTGGYRYIDFDYEIWTYAYSAIDGITLLRDKQKLDSPDGLHFGFASAALVYDSSLFGATSPVLGQRYRFDVSPFVGSINFYSIIADFRRYMIPLRPFTLAVRVMHFGRYGSGAEDSRLYPLFIGFESFVRGYNYGSFTANEVENQNSDLVYDHLFGSKMLLANFELRFPLFGLLGIGRGYYGIFPIEVNAFFDAGVVWTNEETPSFLGGERRPVSSTGIGLRANMFGYFVVGLHYVYPFNRTDKGPYFQLTITPGF